MATHRVPVTRIGYASRDIEVEADTAAEARQRALDAAGGAEFSEHTSDYESEYGTAATLTNIAAALAAAIDGGRHCEPASRIVLDGQHAGTLFTWVDRFWIVYDLENRESFGRHDRLAVVTVTQQQAGEDVADAGLNQCCLACDLEAGEWVVDADDLPELRQTYGDTMEVLWEQAAT